MTEGDGVCLSCFARLDFSGLTGIVKKCVYSAREKVRLISGFVTTLFAAVNGRDSLATATRRTPLETPFGSALKTTFLDPV